MNSRSEGASVLRAQPVGRRSDGRKPAPMLDPSDRPTYPTRFSSARIDRGYSCSRARVCAREKTARTGREVGRKDRRQPLIASTARMT